MESERELHAEMDARRIGQVLAVFGEEYWASFGLSREALQRLDAAGWKDGLAEFLRRYAFERAGRSPRYPEAAATVVQSYPGDIPGGDFEAFVWQGFLQEIGAPPSGKGANLKVNPLAPSRGSSLSITAWVGRLDRDGHNLIRWAKRGLEEGRAPELSRKLQQVRGIGPKIAAFFLRDVVEAFNLEMPNAESAIYLQPIDTWTHRGAEALAPQLGWPAPNKKGEDKKCAHVLVEVGRRAGVRPTLINTGLWMLGGRFAQKEKQFREALSTPVALQRFLDAQRGEQKRKIELLDAALHALQDAG